MNFRSEFIEQLGDFFNSYRPTDVAFPDRLGLSDPIEIQTLGFDLEVPSKPNDADLPAVYFGFGDIRRLQGDAFVESDYQAFSVHVYAQVNRSEGKTLFERQGDMYDLVLQATRAARAFVVNDEIHLENVYINSVVTDKGLLSRYAFMDFDIHYVYMDGGVLR